MGSGIKWILTIYFFVLLFPAAFLTLLGYSDSEENIFVLFVGILACIILILTIFYSYKAKKKDDFKNYRLLVPIYISLISLIFPLICNFTDCIVSLTLMISILIGFLLIKLYLKLIDRYIQKYLSLLYNNNKSI